KASKLSANLLSNGTSQGSFSLFTPISGNPGAYTSTFTAGIGGTKVNIQAFLKGVGAFVASPGITVSKRALSLSGPSSVIAGDCSTALTITYQTVDGAPIATIIDKVISFTGTGNGLIFSNSSCTTPASSVVIP